VVGVKNPDALRFELKDRLIRRTKVEKLNLPEKVRHHIPVTLNPSQQKLYSEAEAAFWLQIEQAIKAGDEKLAADVADVIAGKKRILEIQNGAARTVRLRQIACSPALLGGEDDSAKLDAIVDKIVDNNHLQHVVFTEFVQGANLLVDRLRKKKLTSEAFTGEVADTRVRTHYEDRFQSGEIQVLVGTLSAMREAVTLTAASTVHFCERAWVPGWNEQAEDRLWRNGQENRVLVLIYEGVDSVDTQKVRPTLYLKENIVSSVLKKDTIQEKEFSV
jgi:SNF2 family DNA or RNA helicase